MLKKKILNKRFRFGASIVPLFLLCGCINRALEILENKFFKYIIVDSSTPFAEEVGGVKEKSISIVGFKDFTLQQKAIDIPREINNLPVRYIGWRDPCTYSLHYESPYVPDNCPLNKIFIFENIDFILDANFHNAKVFNCSLRNIRTCGTNAYACHDLADFDDCYLKANVAFLLNNGKSNNPIHRIDYVQKGEEIEIPPIPVLEGFIFNGWFTETECINEYDFETMTNLAEEETLMLYANWIEE